MPDKRRTMTDTRHTSYAKGRTGEDIAVRFLLDRGYEILDRNWRYSRGELDIVVRKDDIIAFVEVKTALSNRFGDPAGWVKPAKQRQIGKIASAWIQEKQPEGCFFRFDVITLTTNADGFDIRHIPNAFSL